MALRVHVIDPDSRRRAAIAREFLGRSMHAEIYEDLAEFRDRIPKEGLVFAVDDPERCEPAELFETMRSQQLILPVALYSPQPSPEKIVQAMLLGALDYLQWPFDPALLASSMERLEVQGTRLTEQERRRSAAQAKLDELTARERQVLLWMIHGNTNREIGGKLGISPRTVEIHRANLMRKLNAGSASDAVRLALYAGLDLESPD